MSMHAYICVRMCLQYGSEVTTRAKIDKRKHPKQQRPRVLCLADGATTVPGCDSVQ